MSAGVDSDLYLPLFVSESKATAELKSDDEKLMWQRESSGFIITLRWLHAIHGKYSKEDSTPATLLVFRVILSNSNSSATRRYKHFRLELKFENIGEGKGDMWEQPYVRDFAPLHKGSITLDESVESHGENSSKEAAIEGGPEYVKLSAKAVKEKTKDKEQKFAMSLEAGKKESGGRGRQGEDIVWWNFKENPSQKRGVVDSFGVVIVIKRSDEFPDDNFVVRCAMKATIDFKYRVDDKIRELTGEREEPFTFNPKTKSRVIPKGLELDALGDYVDSGEFAKLAFLHVPESQEPDRFYNNTAS